MAGREKSELFSGAAGVGPPKPKKPSATAGMSASPLPRPGAKPGGTMGSIPAAAAVDNKAVVARHANHLKEAESARKEAMALIQKTWKRWNPNYFSAAPLFEKAAASYRACGVEDLAMEMFAMAGECHEHVDSWALAAKNYKEAALIAQKAKKDVDASTYYGASATCWVNGGEPGKAGEYFGLSARMLEELDTEKAMTAYMSAVDAMIPPNSNPDRADFIKIIGSREVFEQAMAYMMDNRKLKEALAVLHRYCLFLESEEGTHSLQKMFLTEAILYLAMGDYVSADLNYRNKHLQMQEYIYAKECKIEEDLLTAFKDYDIERLNAALNEPALLRMAPATVRVARGITLDTVGDMADQMENLEDAKQAALPQYGDLSDLKARLGALKAGVSVVPVATPPASPPQGKKPQPPIPTDGEEDEETDDAPARSKEASELFGTTVTRSRTPPPVPEKRSPGVTTAVSNAPSGVPPPTPPRPGAGTHVGPPTPPKPPSLAKMPIPVPDTSASEAHDNNNEDNDNDSTTHLDFGLDELDVGGSNTQTGGSTKLGRQGSEDSLGREIARARAEMEEAANEHAGSGGDVMDELDNIQVEEEEEELDLT